MGWTKHFLVGEPIKEPASFSKTRLNGMSSLELEVNNKILSIHGHADGEFWQSDEYESSPYSGLQMTKRRIEYRIQEHWLTFSDYPEFRLCQNIFCSHMGTPMDVAKQVGQWLIVEYDMKDKSVGFYYSKDKI